MSRLAVLPAYRLAERAVDQSWLVEALWSDEAVGMIGGEPKCCKSFLALDIAVSVAAGVPCLRRYPVPRSGRVLLYAAEDALHTVRSRIEGICAAAGLRIQDLDLQVITAPSLRLDLDADRAQLEETITSLKPRLLVLDPFVRLHRIDENASEVAPLLAFLRELQRRHAMAVILVHHARKGAGSIRGGQALRGSSEFHAWGDSNLYLRRTGEDLVLTVEHRAAAAIPPVVVQLAQHDAALALEVAAQTSTRDDVAAQSIDDRIASALAAMAEPQPFADLRAQCRIRAATLYQRLAEMTANGSVIKSASGYRLAID